MKLNIKFSNEKTSEKAVKIYKWKDTNYFETLCMYCADNDIDTNKFTDNNFNLAVKELEEFGQDDKTSDHYYFSIER